LNDEDHITDTVGVIAVDSKGKIAAGSSSGGIAMKHRGRVGPAALVGVGTVVIPADPDDPEGITVAAAISGTGEHMSTTLAAQTCADRLYHRQRKDKDGRVVYDHEENVIVSFIKDDFMCWLPTLFHFATCGN
jgi:taspase (threonine aspartase 1)